MTRELGSLALDGFVLTFSHLTRSAHDAHFGTGVAGILVGAVREEYKVLDGKEARVMADRELTPRRRGNEGSTLARWEADPIFNLRHKMARMFEDLERLTGFEAFEGAALPSHTFLPALDMSETNDQVRVTAELPGLNKEDVEISVEGDSLMLSGEKKEEKEQREGGYHRSERYYGAFTRRVLLPCQVNFDKAEATFKNGVLTVMLPKTEEAKHKRRKIEIKGA
jgi:HSP20 family protein